MKMLRLLAADIGGTNSRFGVFTLAGSGDLSLSASHWLPTTGFPSFEALMGALYEQLPEARAVEVRVLAVAGPVERSGLYSRPPLIPWDIDVSRMSRTRLINDFVAQAYAALSPLGRRAGTVIEAVPQAGPGTGGAIAVLGAGTGLGKAALVPAGGGGYVVMPSEGGHASFPFSGPEEAAYDGFLKARTMDPYMTYNVVVSGRGLSLLHEHLTGRALPPEAVPQEFGASPRTLALFARFYGRCCRNFALETLCTGGLYIAGGIAALNPEIVRHAGFLGEFRASPSHEALLASIPVHLMDDPEGGLWGAAYHATELLGTGAL